MVTQITSYNIASGEVASLQQQFLGPTITSVVYSSGGTVLDPAGGQTITITGTNFSSPKVVVGNDVMTLTSSSSTQIVFTAPSTASGEYTLAVVNSNGITVYGPIAIFYSATPTWTTAGGTLATQYELTSVNIQVEATSDTTITYEIDSGALPSGVTLSTSGLISGTLPSISSQTTYNFDIRATDLELQTSVRSFSIVSNPDVVTWTSISPVSMVYGTVINQTLSATSAAGRSITYSSADLPGGLSISGNTVTGTVSTSGTFNPTITATAAVTGKSADTSWSITITIAPGQTEYTSAGTYTWTAPGGVSSVCVVCVGGGGGGKQYSSSARGAGGGGLGWKNNIAVVPGTGYTVVVGGGGGQGGYNTSANGGDGGISYFKDTATVYGGGGPGGKYNTSAASLVGGNYLGAGGGNGGAGGFGGVYGGGGGGAGGYTGNGGSGGAAQSGSAGGGSGGGGGGGGNGGSADCGGGGGGVGIYGQGANGGGGGGSTGNATAGGGGSGGANGVNQTVGAAGSTTGNFVDGGAFGGGAGSTDIASTTQRCGRGGVGAVRIIWGPGRAFPSTSTGNL